MRKGVVALSIFAVAIVCQPWTIPLVEAQELPLELRWSTRCPNTINKARLTDLDRDGETEFSYTCVMPNTQRYLQVYTITPDRLEQRGHHVLPTPDGFWPFGEFDLRDINDDGDFDVLIGYGRHRIYIVYGPDFAAGNYHAFESYGDFWLNSVDIKVSQDIASAVVCYGGWGGGMSFNIEWNCCDKFTLPEFEQTGRVNYDGCKHHWWGTDDFLGDVIFLFSNHYIESWNYGGGWTTYAWYGFTITDQHLTTIDGDAWFDDEPRARPLCYAGQLNSDSEIEFLMSHELTLRCYDFRQRELHLNWYIENTADEYLSALDVTGDGIQEAIVADSQGRIWAIDGQHGNTIAAGSIGHQVSDMFFTQHQETGRNLLICYENGDQPILYLYEIGTLTGIDDDKSQQSKPKDFILKQNHPNPFNSRTQIEFFLNKDGEISLEIFDLAGSLVATLQEGRKQAGKHLVEWNGEGFASGIYLYRLTSGESTQIRKMILLK